MQQLQAFLQRVAPCSGFRFSGQCETCPDIHSEHVSGGTRIQASLQPRNGSADIRFILTALSGASQFDAHAVDCQGLVIHRVSGRNQCKACYQIAACIDSEVADRTAIEASQAATVQQNRQLQFLVASQAHCINNQKVIIASLKEKVEELVDDRNMWKSACEKSEALRKNIEDCMIEVTQDDDVRIRFLLECPDNRDQAEKYMQVSAEQITLQQTMIRIPYLYILQLSIFNKCPTSSLI